MKCDRRYTTTFVPTEDSWSVGHRSINCLQESFGLANSESHIVDRIVASTRLQEREFFNNPPIQFDGSVEIVECQGDWEFRVVNILIIESDATLPNEEDISKLSFMKCDRRYTTTFVPTQDSWRLGHRSIICLQESFGLSAANPSRLDRLVDPSRLMTGECYVTNPAMFNVEIVSCSGNWDLKVLSSFELDLEGEYPGEDYLFGLGEDRCGQMWDFVLYPTIETWQLGDRKVSCLQGK